MPCCLLCFSDDPVDGATQYPNQWHVSFCDGCSAAPCACCFGFWCAECSTCWLRHKVLKAENKWPSGYKCCQGMVCAESPCVKASGPDNAMLCLCLEACCCTGCAASGTYLYTQQRYGLLSDPWYNRWVRLNNCCQMLACCCSILACFFDEFSEAARCIRIIADLIFRCLMGCISSQVSIEIDHQLSKGTLAHHGAEPPMIAPTPVPQGHYVQPGYTPQPQPAPQHWNLNPQHQPQPGHAPHPTKGKGEKSGKGEKGDRPARPAGRRGKRGGVARAAHYFEDAQRRADEGERQAYANVIAVLADRHHPGPRAALDRLLDARHAADRAREAASAAYRRHIQEQKARAAQKMHVTENAWELADAGHEEEQDEAVEAAAADDEEEKEEAEEAVPGLPHLTPDAFSTPSSLTPMF
eukprot:TRINITY_DN2295_c0_g2_i1.p1 TRINITY_DN2295_c0_g2~~TRINITY_DN2295_c0_g2_i1.p1  ORF type:complete len:411 (+),score=65.01 TRINITY_DN2295_c0_g2_i1:56-1288(+)